jgi:hypothetical protein
MAAVDGGGVRYNEGKAPYDVLPLSMLLDWVYGTELPDHPAFKVLSAMGRWQLGEDGLLDDALHATMCAQGHADSLVGVSPAAAVFEHVTKRPVKPYPRWNWMRGMAWSIPLGCIVRHSLAWAAGQDLDPETGLPHFGHIQCNLVMLKFYATHFQQGDDRPKDLFPKAAT